MEVISEEIRAFDQRISIAGFNPVSGRVRSFTVGAISGEASFLVVPRSVDQVSNNLMIWLGGFAKKRNSIC